MKEEATSEDEGGGGGCEGLDAAGRMTKKAARW